MITKWLRKLTLESKTGHCALQHQNADATGATEMDPDERGLLAAIHDCIAALEAQLEHLHASQRGQQDDLIHELEKILEEIRASIAR